MPIINLEDEGIPKEEIPSTTVFNKDTKLENIVRNIKGLKWKVDYYLQIKENEEPFVQLDINLPVNTQKYTKIKNLDLLVQSTINQDKVYGISGSALLYSGFVPNVGDMFMVKLTGDRPALFTITEVEIKTYNISTAYELSYKLYCFLDSDPHYLENIEHKTMNTLVYNRNYMLDDSSPILTEHSYHEQQSLKDIYTKTLDWYLRKYTSKYRNTLSECNTVDPYLISFIKRTTETNEHPLLCNITHIDTEKVPTIWDTVIERSSDNLKLCYLPKTVPTSIRKIDTTIRVLYANGINYILGEPDEYNGGSYVVSKDFYSNLTPTDTTEELLLVYYGKHELNLNKLKQHIQTLKQLGGMTCYYQIPVILGILKAETKGKYDILV